MPDAFKGLAIPIILRLPVIGALATRVGAVRGGGQAWATDRTGTDCRGSRRPAATGSPYFVLLTVCIGFFVLSWAVLDRYPTIAAVVVSVMTLAIPPFAAIIANTASAADRRHPKGPLSARLKSGSSSAGWPCRVLQSGHG